MPAAIANGFSDRGAGAGKGGFDWVERDFDMDWRQLLPYFLVR